VAERENEAASEAVLPLVEETLRVGKRQVETGRVRVSVSTDVQEQVVRETLRSERAELERVPIGRELAVGEPAPALRREPDGTVVVPVLEEVLVVERRLVLKEEIRMRLVAVDEAVEQPVTVRRQRATVERLPPPPAEVGSGNAG
jgi:stress response protein YsnF